MFGLGTLFNIVVAQLAAFAVIVIVLKRILLSDTMNAVKRMREVEGELARKEEAARRKVEDGERELARRGQEGRDEVERSREEMIKQVEKQRQGVLEEANAERERIVREAKQSEDRIRRELLQDLDEKAVSFASGMVEMVFGQAMTKSLHRRFLDELIAALEELDEATISVDPSQVEFRAGQPLEEDQRKRIAELLATKFSVTHPFEEKVEPELLSGLVIRLGDLEIDGTLKSRLREAADELRKRHSF